MNIPKIPLADWIGALETWLDTHLSPLFKLIKVVVGETVGGLNTALDFSLRLC